MFGFFRLPRSSSEFLTLFAAGLVAAGIAILLLTLTGARLAWLVAAPAWAVLPTCLWWLRKMRAALDQVRDQMTALRADRQLDQFRVARRDTLTGLINRQAFLDRLAGQFARGASFALMIMDLDRFETINTNHGEAVGDEVLLAFAGRLRAMARPDHAARLDGDCFALLVTTPGDVENLERSTADILASLTGPQTAAGQLVDLGASIGVAVAGIHGQTGETLLRAARAAMLIARQQGGGRFHLCGNVQAGEILSRQRARRELQRAIEAGHVLPYYQPIVSLPSSNIAKFEVLARWNHPELGLLLPEDFIPVADEMGLSGQISMSLLRQVAIDTQDWPKACRFAINVSAGQVREMIGLLNAQPGVWQCRLDLSRLDVEISEAALMQDHALARELIDVLHEHGARAVLDNFGNGQSNFFHLRDLPFDSIKINKFFVQHLIEDPRAEACVLAMLWLGLGLGIDIVADGVETTEIAERLSKMGCHFAQGFLYARPASAEIACASLGIAADQAA